MGDLTIESVRDGTLGLLRMKGEARLEVVGALRDRARELSSQGAKHLLVGLADVGFIDSASIGVVLELQKEFAEKGGSIVLVGPRPRFRRLIDGMGLSGRFRFAADETAARALLINAG